MLCKYLQTFSLMATTPHVFSMEALSSMFILTLLQSAARRTCPFKPSMTVYLSWDDSMSALAYYEVNFLLFIWEKKKIPKFCIEICMNLRLFFSFTEVLCYSLQQNDSLFMIHHLCRNVLIAFHKTTKFASQWERVSFSSLVM